MSSKNKKIDEIIALTNEKMIEMDYNPNTIYIYKRFWKQFSCYSNQRGIHHFEEELGFRFLKEIHNWPNPEGHSRDSQYAARAIRVLGDFQLHKTILRGKAVTIKVWRENFQKDFDSFIKYLSTQNISDSSISRIEQVVDKFLTHLVEKGIKRCSEITYQEIESFINTLSGYAKKTLSVNMYSLRVFLGYLHTSKDLHQDLRKKVPTIRNVNRRSLPSTWTKEETKKIIESVERTNPCGKRDYAILMIMAKLGLRQCDIINLTFEHFDWSNGLLKLTQVKTKKSLTLPIPEDVGNAIIDYLKNGRPQSNLPFVFLKQTYPFEQMKTVYMIMDKYVKLAGVKRRPGGQKGSHTLRHSLAGRLLENQTPIEIISAVLGHSSIHSTNDYLKVDFKSLAECAIDPDESVVGGLGNE